MKLKKIFGYCLTALIILSGLYLYVWQTTDTQAVSPFRPPVSCDTLEAPELSVLGDSSIQLGGYVNLRYKYFPQDNTGCGYNNCRIIPATIPNSGNLTFSGNGTVDPTDPAYRLIRTTPVEDTDYKIICSTNPSACNCRKESEPVHINVYHMRLYTDDDVYYFESDTLQTHINWEIDSRLHDCSLTADPSVNGLPISPTANGRLLINLSNTTTLKLTCFDSAQTEISKTIYIAKKDCENQEICLRAYMKTPPPAGQVFTVNKDSHTILKYNIKHSGYNTCTLSTIPAQPILPVQEMINGVASVRYVSEITRNYSSLEAGDYEFPGFGDYGDYKDWNYITVSQDTKFQLVCHGVNMTVDEYGGGEGEGGYAICQANSDGTGGTIIYADCSGCRALGGTMKCTPAGSDGCGSSGTGGEESSCGGPVGCVGGTCLVPTGDPNTSRLEVMHPTGQTRHVATFTAMDFTTVTVGSANNKCDISEDTYSCKANGNTEASCDSSNLNACCSDSSVYGSGYQCTTGTCQAGSDKGQSFCNSGEKCCKPESCSDYGTGYQCTTGTCQAGSDKGQSSCNTNQKCCKPSNADACVIESVNMKPKNPNHGSDSDAVDIDDGDSARFDVDITTNGHCSTDGDKQFKYEFSWKDTGNHTSITNTDNEHVDNKESAHYSLSAVPLAGYYLPEVTVTYMDNGNPVVGVDTKSDTSKVYVLSVGSSLPDLKCSFSPVSDVIRSSGDTVSVRYQEYNVSNPMIRAGLHTSSVREQIDGVLQDPPFSFTNVDSDRPQSHPYTENLRTITCDRCGASYSYHGIANTSYSSSNDANISNNECNLNVTCSSAHSACQNGITSDVKSIFLGKTINLKITSASFSTCDCYLKCSNPETCGLVKPPATTPWNRNWTWVNGKGWYMNTDTANLIGVDKPVIPTDTYKSASYVQSYTITCFDKPASGETDPDCSNLSATPVEAAVYVLPIPWWREIVTNLTAYLNGIFISK